jgi:hypothetical protein
MHHSVRGRTVAILTPPVSDVTVDPGHQYQILA